MDKARTAEEMHICDTGASTFTGAGLFNGAVTSGDKAEDAITITGNTQWRGTFGVTGASTFTGDTDFDGTVRLGNQATDTITITGNAAAAGTLAVAGTAAFSGAVTRGDALGTSHYHW